MALADIIENIKAWDNKRKIAAVVVLALSIAIIVTVTLWSQKEEYHVLFSNLTQEDAGSVMAKLKEMKVPYKVDGNVIYVPQKRVYELRLELASMGLPQGGLIGFEIFDKTNFGITEFVQRLNYVRALQGELARTIKQLSEVESARVHIAMPEKSIFTEKEQKPSASIVLKLKPGRSLSQSQVGGIVHLVSSSVEGLSPQSITILDNLGNLLSKPHDTESITDGRLLEYQKFVDKTYEQKIQSMLEPIVGKGKAIVRVTTKLDLKKIETTEEKFDPDSATARTQQKTTEQTSGASTGGIPGVLSNQPGQPSTSAGVGGQVVSQKQTETTNYEISRTLNRISQPGGELKSISVAVLVDGTYKKDKDKKVYTPRTEEEMKKFNEVVKAAIGYNRERGDQVIVDNVAFEGALEEMPPEKVDIMSIATTVLRYLVPLIIVLLIFLFVIKPLMTTIKTVPKKAKEPVLPPEAVLAPAAVSPVPPEPELPPEEVMKQKVLEIVKKDPRQAAHIIREWMAES
ncbi:MAG: flagellar basal-body MS-ring/collar protein FliF [Thermodesulfovibrionales bacterium]|nr:flagellar basal-body MS-ring/collar protein FliF [Thermodesulfovibrionales bacterium]